MRTILEDGQTILFIGDSITDCGRCEDRGRPLGMGYVRFFSDMLVGREPEKRISVINRGIGGNTVDDLRSRWHDDVVWLKPDWLSIKIGINDVNQYLCDKSRDFLRPEGYRKIYEQILNWTVAALPHTKLLLIEPFYMSRDQNQDAYRAKVLRTLADYIAVVRSLAEKYQARLVKMHDIFQEQLAHRHPSVFCDEPVHPNATGHLLIAESVYRALSE